jgi:hypothetical protein
MCDRDEVFELRLDEFAGTLALVGNSIITNIAFAVNLKSKRIPCGSLQAPVMFANTEVGKRYSPSSARGLMDTVQHDIQDMSRHHL